MREPGKVSIYLCGPTVYGPPHLGHGRATLEYDILRRYLAWTGIEVRLVSNITDIDDKIIERAEREGRDAGEIAERCESVWWRAMDSIGVLRPDRHPARHGVGRRDGRHDRRADRDRPGLRHRRRRVPVGRDGRGLRPAGPAALEDLLAGGGEREVFGAERKRQPGRLRAVEAGQAGRADVAVAVGRRPAGLAQRVRRDEPRAARRGLRPALRRPRPQVPAPRERAGPGRRPRQALRQPLDAPRLRRRPHAARRCPSRSATSRTSSTTSPSTTRARSG